MIIADLNIMEGTQDLLQKDSKLMMLLDAVLN